MRRARRQAFVGREAELALMRESLDDPGAPRVLLVHGPGGVGKSALLARFAASCAELGRGVMSGDALLRGAPVERSAVVLLDGLDDAPGVARRLREEILPELPGDALVVLAGRGRPDAGWSADPGWRELVRAVPLGPLSPGEAGELLRRLRAPVHAREALLGFAAGNPLALTLAVDDETRRDWRPSEALVLALVERLVGAAPDAACRRALLACAHLAGTTVDVVRRVVPDSDAATIFEWLRGLALVEPGPHGLVVDELPARLLDIDHQWRDPEGYADMHRDLWQLLGERALADAVVPDPAAVAGLVHLQHYRDPRRWERSADSGLPSEATAVEPSPDEVREVARAHLVDDARVEHWLKRQPHAFHVFGGSGSATRDLSVLAVLRLSEADDHDLTDPVVAAAWAHATGSGALRADQEVRIARFVLPHPRSAFRGTPDPRLRRWYEELHRRPDRLAASYVAVADPDRCVPLMSALDHHLVARVREVDGSEWGVYAHDWRRVPPEQYLARSLPRVGSAHEPPELSLALGRSECDAAVRQALRHWYDDEIFAANPLLRVAFRQEVDPPAALRRCVEAAVATLAADPRRTKQHRAVCAAYLRAPVTREAAAHQLGVPLSTFRRHLAEAEALLCARLRAQMQGLT